MNTIYRIIFNAATEHSIVASELAKGRKPVSSIRMRRIGGLLMAASLMGLNPCVAAPSNSFSSGILGGSGDCFNSTADGAQTGNTLCDAGGAELQAAMVAYGASGGWGAYVSAVDSTTLRLGAGGFDQLRITNTGLTALNAFNMSGNTIKSLAAGVAAGDAVNVAQLNASTRYFKAGGAKDGSDDARTTNVNAVAVGRNAVAGQNAVAVGSGSNAGVLYATAIGDTSTASQQGTAVGYKSRATGNSASAFGNISLASGQTSVAFGHAAEAGGSSSIAVGAYTISSGALSSSVGYFARASGDGAMAIGTGTTASGYRSSAIGYAANAYGHRAIALGTNATVDSAAEYGVALGTDARVTATNSVALGNASQADRANTVSVGAEGAERVITNVSAGVLGTDAVNVAQLSGVTNALGGGAGVNPDGTVKAPIYHITNIDGGITTVNNVGDAISNLDDRTSRNSTDIANLANNITNGDLGLVKYDAAALKVTIAADKDATEVAFANVDGSDRRLTGVATGTADNDAVNVSQLRDMQKAVAATGERSVKYKWLDANSNGMVDPGEIDFSVAELEGPISSNGGVTGGTTITNLHRGTVTATSTEAINGSQLYATANSIATHLGGGAGVNADGTVKAPVYKLADGVGGSSSYDNVGDALGNLDTRTTSNTTHILNLDGRVTNVEGDISNLRSDVTNLDGRVVQVEGDVANLSTRISNGQVGLVKQDSPDSSITVAQASGGTEVSVSGTAGDRRISGVADATAATDAINLRMMQKSSADAVSTANAYTDSRVDDVWQDMSRGLNQVSRQANRGIAAASALINVTPYVPGHTTVNAGVAGYRGEAAVGVGVSRWTSDGRVNFNGGISAAQGDSSVIRVGVGYIF